MRKVQAERYKKRKMPEAEEIDFTGPTIEPKGHKRGRSDKVESRDDPSKKRTEKPSNERSDDVRTANTYLIEVPEKRTKIRHSFDIFEDQKLALDHLQMATYDIKGEKPNLGDMVQRALDDYIEKRTDELPSVRMSKRRNERSNEISAHE